MLSTLKMKMVPSCNIYLSHSQVDYRAKLWACNFCFQRNQVCDFFKCFSVFHFGGTTLKILSEFEFVSALVVISFC